MADIKGTFTGFLKSLNEVGVTLVIDNTEPSVITLRAENNNGKFGEVKLPAVLITGATEDVASVELGELINAML